MSNHITEERCFHTTESILVDGANGVCRRPDIHRPLSHGATLFAIALIGAAAWAFTRSPADRRRRHAAIAAIGFAMVMLALPGLSGVLVRRHDAPAARPVIAHQVQSFVDRVQRYASSHHGCVDVVDEGCVACTPIARFALSDPHHCAHPQGRVFLYAHSLVRGCREAHGDLVCGDAP